MRRCSTKKIDPFLLGLISGLSHQLKKRAFVSIPVTRRDVNLSPHIRQVDQCFMFNVRLVDLVCISFKLVSVWDLELGRRLSTFLGLQETLGAACFCGVGSFFLASVVLVYLCDRLLPATSSRRGYSPPPLICSSRSSRGRCGTPTPCTALTPPLTPPSSPKVRCSAWSPSASGS